MMMTSPQLAAKPKENKKIKLATVFSMCEADGHSKPWSNSQGLVLCERSPDGPEPTQSPQIVQEF